MEKIKSVLICALIVIIILLRTCGNVNIKSEAKYIHDTITVEKWDTIYPSKTKIALKPKNLTPVASYTINGTLPSFDSICSLKRIYKDSIADSNLTFYWNIETIGILDKFEPSYKLKIPYKIIHTIDRTVDLTPKPKIHFYGGLMIGGNSQKFNLAPFIAIADKKRNIYVVNYNLLDKTANLGFGIKFR